MKIIFFSFLLSLCLLVQVNAQVLCSATDDNGNGYNAITLPGFEIENPDCLHDDFGAHITMTYDDLLERNVFEFHSHIDEDTDRCEAEDRIRMEIKGGPNSNTELQHPEGSTSYYRWKFMVPADFVGASSFCHIFQDKIKGGSDSSFPVVTFTLRSSILEVLHNGGDTGTDLGRLASVDLTNVRGKWMEAYVEATHSENGQLVVSIKDMSTQEVLIDYANTDIDLWRDGGEYSRPKYGIYRSKNSSLKDEIMLFADFCVSETSKDLCPADPFIILDQVAPSVPTGLTATDVMINNVTLSWEASSDNIGVTDYILFQDGIETYRGDALSTTLPTVGSTTYQYAVAATDAAGNVSDQSVAIEVITDDATSLPEGPSNISPADGSVDMLIPAFLNWNGGENTDNYTIYLGTSQTPEALTTQEGTGYSAAGLEENTTYYWRVGANNINGETLGNLWSFTTGVSNSDLPWKVYRANERMHIETDFLTEQDKPADPDVDIVFADPEHAGNSLYSYFEEDDEKFRWRNSFSETDTAFTVVARFKALNEDVDCVCYFEVRGFGFREKVRINQSTIKLERSTPVIEEDIPFDIAADFHMLRMTMTGNTAYIYLDENPTPFAIGNSTTTDTNFNFEWGKSGNNLCGGTIDWLTILNNQALAPGEGPELPSDLLPFNTGGNDIMPASNLEATSITTNSATISWTAATGENPIVSYSLLQDGESIWGGEELTADVMNLEPATYYTYTVIATDDIGQNSEPSEVVGLTTKGQDDGNWLVYRANADPIADADFFEVQDIPVEPSFDKVIDDPNGSVNKYYQYGQLDTERFRWRHRFESTDTAITIVTRIKAIDADPLAIVYLEIYGFGWREKLRLNSNSIKLEKSDPQVEVDLPGDILRDFHVLRLTMEGPVMNVYLNEDPTPFAVGLSAEEKESVFFEFGKSGNNECGGEIDWMTILANAAYAPGEGPALPADLFLSSIARLSNIAIDGVDIPDFDPDSTNYVINLGSASDIPVVSVNPTSDLATFIITDPLSVPNSATIIDIMAQDGFTTQQYQVAYTGSVSVQDEFATSIIIFPNPLTDLITVNWEGNSPYKLSILDSTGKVLKSKTTNSGDKLDLRMLTAGVYFLEISDEGSMNVIKKIIKTK